MSSLLDDIQLAEPSARQIALRSALISTAGDSAAESGDTAQINEGILLAFEPSLSTQNKADTSNSFLFAQLAADKKYNRHSATADWVKTFFATLSLVGWTLSASGHQGKTVKSPADWQALVIPFLPEAVWPLARSSIAACQALSAKSKPIALWEGAALDKEDGILIVTVAWSGNGSLNTSLVGIDFTYGRDVAGFMAWDEYFNLNVQTLSLTLNEDIYAQVRQTIINKLGDRPDYLVVNVPVV
jgi:hypothetical protein